MSNEKYSELTLKIDRIRIEMKEVGKILGSISPKLSLHKEYEKKLQKLNDEYDKLKKERSHLSHESVALR